MNFSVDDTIKFNDIYSANATTKCSYLKVAAIYVISLFTVSVVTNVTLLWVLLKRKEMRTPVNSFIIYFTFLSLYGTFSEFPLITISMLKCR
jgi:hypothetical protein